MLNNKYDFVLLVDCSYGNPNGDPDADNMPRIDYETQHGQISPMCIKRKIRNYILKKYGGEGKYNIVVQSDRPLNDKYADAYKSLGLEKQKKTKDKAIIAKACKAMEDHFYDVRVFGQVMTTGEYSCGRVKGPVQIGMGVSIDPVSPTSMTITRNAKTTKERAEDSDTEFGQYKYIPYGLYKFVGHISPGDAKKTGMTEEDLQELWEAMMNMYEDDHSTARGEMTVRKLVVFKHESPLGNCRYADLEKCVQVKKKDGVSIPRSIDDYDITVDHNVPAGVSVTEML